MAFSVIQKAACEAVWRALHERNVDRTNQCLTNQTPEPVARARIAEYVAILPHELLPRLITPEVTRYGPLRGGYTSRWQSAVEPELPDNPTVKRG